MAHKSISKQLRSGDQLQVNLLTGEVFFTRKISTVAGMEQQYKYLHFPGPDRHEFVFCFEHPTVARGLSGKRLRGESIPRQVAKGLCKRGRAVAESVANLIAAMHNLKPGDPVVSGSVNEKLLYTFTR